MNYSKLLIGTFITSLVLSGCSGVVEPTIEEVPKMEEDYKSVLSYIEKNNIVLDDEVKRDDEGLVIEKEESEKEPWELKNHVSVVHIIPGVKLGVDKIEVENIDDVDNYKKYIVLSGVIYNTNEKEVAYGVIGDSSLVVDTKDLKLYGKNKELLIEKKVNFFDATDTSLKFAPNSETPINLYYQASSSELDLLGTVRLRNLNLDLLIREKVYEEDRTEEHFNYLDIQNAKLLLKK